MPLPCRTLLRARQAQCALTLLMKIPLGDTAARSAISFCDRKVVRKDVRNCVRKDARLSFITTSSSPFSVYVVYICIYIYIYISSLYIYIYIQLEILYERSKKVAYNKNKLIWGYLPVKVNVASNTKMYLMFLDRFSRFKACNVSVAASGVLFHVGKKLVVSKSV